MQLVMVGLCLVVLFLVMHLHLERLLWDYQLAAFYLTFLTLLMVLLAISLNLLGYPSREVVLVDTGVMYVQ